MQLVDRVGGGDAFAAGLVYSIVKDKTAQAALDFAAAAGALKLTIAGDWNLARAEEVERIVAEKSRGIS